MLFQILLPFQSTAITNAETIIAETQGIKPLLAESSTTVHILVKKLNEYSDINNIPELAAKRESVLQEIETLWIKRRGAVDSY